MNRHLKVRKPIIRIAILLTSLMALMISAGVAQAALSCSSCHGGPPADTAGGNRNQTTGATQGNHQTHPWSGNYNSCQPCHGDGVLTYTSAHSAYTSATQPAPRIVMSSNIHNSNVPARYSKAVSSTFFNQTSIPVMGYCSNVNCHFESNSPTWGQPSSLWLSTLKSASNSDPNNTCQQCHQNGILSGPHAKHLANYGGTTSMLACAKCHPDNYGKTGTAAFAHSSTATRPVDVHFNTAPNNGVGSISGQRVYPNFLPSVNGSTAGITCSSLYCHKGASPNPTWTGTVSCNSCHDATNSGGLSTTHGSHYATASVMWNITGNSAHGSTYVYGCRVCHVTNNHVQGSAGTNNDAEIALTAPSKITAYTAGGSNTNDGRGYKFSPGTCTTLCHTRDGATNGSAIVAVNWNTAKASTSCGVCHNKFGDASPSWSAPHTKHMHNYSTNSVVSNCNSCHSVTAANRTTLQPTAAARNQHPNQVKNVDLAVGRIGGSWSGTQCNNTYCHSNGTALAGTHALLSWSGTIGNCIACHNGNNAAASKMATGAHSAHINYTSATGRFIGCAECHAATVSNDTTLKLRAVHVNRSTNIKFDNVYNKNSDAPTWATLAATGTNGAVRASGGAATAQCANVYCHSTGNVNNAGTAVAPSTFKPVAWNSTGFGCASCHGDGVSKAHPTYASGSAGSATANSHVAHVESAAYSCDFCHYTTTKDSVLPPTKVIANGAHLNRQDDVSLKNGGTYTAGTKRCSTTTCHGANSPAWGANTSNASCTKCHGKPTPLATYSSATYAQAAPGYAGVGTNTAGVVGTITSNVSNDTKVGAHDVHVRGLNGYTSSIGCANCHANVTSSANFTGHEDGSSTMTWSNMAKNIGTTPYNADKGAIVPNYSGGSCSTVYCHGGGFAAAVQGTGLTPTWTDGTYLANPASAKNATDCNKCHQSPPVNSVKYDHSATSMPAGLATDCSACHPHNGSGPMHIDGALQGGGGCNGCHDYDTVGSTYTNGVWSGGSWGKSAKDGLTPGQGWGAHAKHINHIKTRLAISTVLDPNSQTFGSGVPAQVCGTCHTNINDASHHTTAGSTTGRQITFGDGAYLLGSFSIRFDASLAPTYMGASGTTSATQAKTCANISCHYMTSPNWSTY